MKLIRLGDGLFRIEDEFKTIEAGYAKITTMLRFEFEVPLEEVNAALEEMNETGNDSAEFKEGWFIRTFNHTKERNIRIELAVLQAVRAEFTYEYKRDSGSKETRLAHERLMSLYSSLDVEGLLKVFECRDEKKVA